MTLVRKSRLIIAWLLGAWFCHLYVPMGWAKFDPASFWTALFAHWGSPHLNARRQFRSTPSAQEPISLDVNDEGMHYRSATTDASVSWNHYCKWSEDESVFVLFTSAILLVLIPKRAFDRDKVVLFKEILCQKIRG